MSERDEGRDEFRDWDAAYVLGSLSVDDRHEFERHLAGCSACAVAVAELAGLPGLLAKVPSAEAEQSLGRSAEAAPDLLPRLVNDVARRRRRTRRIVAGLTIAGVAGALALAPLVVPALVEPFVDQASEIVVMQLSPVAESPLAASIRLVEEEWGTRIDMECRYQDADGYGAADYAMYVTDAAGDEARIATWTASPGYTATPSGTTSLAVADIRSVDVRTASDGRVVLRGSP